MLSSKRQRGFTFAEVLAAMLFLAIVIPVAIEGIVIANRVTSRATHKRQAVLLADKVLNECVVTNSWQNGSEEGDFGEDAPGYAWSVTTANWELDNLTLVTAAVSYRVQGVAFSESVSTVVRDPNASGSSTPSGSTGGTAR